MRRFPGGLDNCRKGIGIWQQFFRISLKNKGDIDKNKTRKYNNCTRINITVRMVS